MAVSPRLPSLWLLVPIAAASVAAAGLVTPALSAPGTTAQSLPLVTAYRTAS